jgi:hypothetical protein
MFLLFLLSPLSLRLDQFPNPYQTAGVPPPPNASAAAAESTNRVAGLEIAIAGLL